MNYENKFFSLMFFLCLTSCFGYSKQEISSMEIDFNDYDSKSKSNMLIYDSAEYSNINKNYIIREFGKPSNVKIKDDFEILEYERKPIELYDIFSFIIPFKIKNKNKISKYDFTFKNDELQKVRFDAIKQKYVFLIPPYFKTTEKSLVNIATSKGCNKELKNKIRFYFPNMKYKVNPIKTQCSRNKLISLDGIFYNMEDYNPRPDINKRASHLFVFSFDRKVFLPKNKIFEDPLKEKIEEIFIDENLNFDSYEEKIEINNLNCKIFKIVAKKYPSVTRGLKFNYLFFNLSEAICSNHKKNLIFSIGNLNMFPDYMEGKIDTKQELIDIIKTIKINM